MLQYYTMQRRQIQIVVIVRMAALTTQTVSLKKYSNNISQIHVHINTNMYHPLALNIIDNMNMNSNHLITNYKT